MEDTQDIKDWEEEYESKFGKNRDYSTFCPEDNIDGRIAGFNEMKNFIRAKIQEAREEEYDKGYEDGWEEAIDNN